MPTTHLIKTVQELKKLYDDVNPNSLAKETPRLTPEYEKWLQSSNFFSLATVGVEGLDCSPRGDKTGQLHHIIDSENLAIPDRRGNNRIDSLQNIIEDPRVALLFFIPGVNECLRINGLATLTTDPQFINRFDVSGKLPKLVILVKIQSVYFQCARAIIRSNLWSSENQLNSSGVPTAGQMTKGAKSDFDADAYDRVLPTRQKDSLY